MTPPIPFPEAWASMVREHRDEFFMATEAHAKLGDISRDDPDYMRVSNDPYTRPEDDENYYGSWLTGLGFFNVAFPKATTRLCTEEEIEWLATHPVVIA
jgi:hypothetical protein